MKLEVLATILILIGVPFIVVVLLMVLKEFGEMSNQILEAAIKCDIGARESALAKTVISSTYAPELLFAVPPEMNYNISQKIDPSEIMPIFVLVYILERRVSEKEYAYVFAGARVK